MNTHAQIRAGRPAVKAAETPFVYLPIGLFGTATGMAGLGSAWNLAHVHFALPIWPATLFTTMGIAGFFILLLAYGIKAFTAPATVLAEFTHPVLGCLFNLVPIGFLLLPIPLSHVAPNVAVALWVIGAVSCVGTTWFIIYRWLSSRQQVETAVPAWIVGVGAPLNLPLAIPALGLKGVDELAVFALSVGLFLCVPVFTLILFRLLFQEPPTAQVKAAFLVLTAPFSIGYSAYVTITGHNDLFAQSLFMVNLFLLAVLFPLLRYLPQNCPFRASWWAVSFPLAASTTAAFRYASAAPGRVNESIAMVLLAVTTTIIVWLTVRTIHGIAKGQLRALLSP